MRYELTEAVRCEINTPMWGQITCEFAGGVHEPKSEQEEYVLRALVQSGIATLVESPKETRKGRAAEGDA